MPHYEVKVTKHVMVPAGIVWSVLEPGDGLEKWLPAIAQCRLDGAGVGATRFCTLGNGAQLVETITTIDAALREFRYTIDDHPMPATNLSGAVRVTDAGNGTSMVTWSAHFDAEVAAHAELEPMFRDIYSQAIDGLAAHAQQRTAPH